MVRLGIMANEGKVDASSWSIVVYKSMFGGGHATSMVKVTPSAGAKATLPGISKSTRA